MKAVRIKRYGNEEVMELAEVEQPKPGARQVTLLPLVEVKKAHQLSSSGHAEGKIILRPYSNTTEPF